MLIYEEVPRGSTPHGAAADGSIGIVSLRYSSRVVKLKLIKLDLTLSTFN